jgi:glycosyltransferase involved in cell wall biosynthesis
MGSDIKLRPITTELIVPGNDVIEPTVTVLVPVMNEEITIATFCQWCHEGFKRAGVIGEILLIDSSDDLTPEIALANGARVLRVPRNGIGRAYQDAIQHVRGEYVVLGDADCTYDFRDLGAFVSKLQEGFDLVMGTRFRGRIERGSIPIHHI